MPVELGTANRRTKLRELRRIVARTDGRRQDFAEFCRLPPSVGCRRLTTKLAVLADRLAGTIHGRGGLIACRSGRFEGKLFESLRNTRRDGIRPKVENLEA